MKLSDYNPFNSSFVKETYELFDYLFRLENVKSEKSNSELVYTFEVPGFKRDEVEVKFIDNLISVAATNKSKTYSASVSVSQVAKEAEISAKLEDGLLTVRVPLDTGKLENRGKIIPVS